MEGFREPYGARRLAVQWKRSHTAIASFPRFCWALDTECDACHLDETVQWKRSHPRSTHLQHERQERSTVHNNLVLAAAVLSTIPLLAPFVLTGRQLVAGIMQGAVKA